MATLTISDQSYQKLQALAQEQGQTPETLIESWVTAHGAQHQVYHSEEEFMQALGMSEERIARIMAEPVEPEPGEEYEHADL